MSPTQPCLFDLAMHAELESTTWAYKSLQQDLDEAQARLRILEAENARLREQVTSLKEQLARLRALGREALLRIFNTPCFPSETTGLRHRLTAIIALLHPDRFGGDHPAATEATRLLLQLREEVTP